MRRSAKTTLIALLGIFALNACATIPKGAVAVKPFDKNRYLGKWYEIARFDFRFERNLNNTTATYSLNSNGTIKVVNRGFNYVKNKWKQAEGKAKFVGASDLAMLKVSFFGPFYGGYNVIALDDDYQYALIAGSSLDYLWLLSRTTSMPDSVKNEFLRKAEAIGFNTQNLIWVTHESE
jgi:apolipoprotein D and lipocalin family protein